MKKVLYTSIFKELIISFSISLLIFTFFLVMNKIIKLTELVLNKGAGFINILNLFIYMLPTFLIFTIPMASLTAILVTSGRISSDREIIAIKSSGLSLYQILPPVIAFSILTFILTSFSTIYLLPYGNYSFRKLLYNIAHSRAYIGIKEKVFTDDFEGLVIYVDKVEDVDERFKGVFISDKRDYEKANVIVSKEGQILSDPISLSLILRLFKGTIHRTSIDKLNYQKVDFDIYDLKLSLNTTLQANESDPKRPKDMSLSELRNRIQKLKKERKKAIVELLEFNKKFSLPFACIGLTFMAFPLGFHIRKSGSSPGYILSLIIILFYYIFLYTGESLSEMELISPFVALWTPNFLLITLGIYFMVKTARDSKIIFVDYAGDVVNELKLRIINFIEKI